MTFLELQNMVAQWCDDVSFGYFTQSFVKLMVNNAAYEVYKLLNKTGEYRYLKCLETETVANQQQYIVPSDFITVEKLVFVDNPGTTQESEIVVAPLTLNQVRTFVAPLVDSNGPAVYHLQRDRLVIYPAPQSERTLRLYYSYLPSPMVDDDDEPDAPINYHEYIAVLATKSCFLKDKQPVAPIQDKLDEYTAMLKASAQERHRDMPRMVVETEYPWGSEW